MFDDPKRELQRLQKELLAEEENWDDLSDIQIVLDDYEEEDSIEALLREFGSQADVTLDRRSDGYSQWQPDAGQEEPDFTASAAVYREEPQKKAKSSGKKKKKQQKEKGVGGLVFLAVLETLGILAVAAWWVVMLL